jgi:hypothetical protein
VTGRNLGDLSHREAVVEEEWGVGAHSRG